MADQLPRYIRVNCTITPGSAVVEQKLQGMLYREVPCKVVMPHPWLGWLGVKVERDSTRQEEYWEDVDPQIYRDRGVRFVNGA